MPQRNTIKVYLDNGFYHIYNRGVEKRDIFVTEQDYKVFLKYLKEILSKPPDINKIITIFTLQGASFKGIPRQPKNYFDQVKLLAYCLMPNHFHLIIQQTEKFLIEKFMRSLATRYSMYFNKKYHRVGKLFQGHYKAVLIDNDNYLLHLSRYIHLNPQEYTKDLINAYSSYAEYLGIRKTTWIKTDLILSFFKKSTLPGANNINTYKKFVENYKKDSTKIIGKLTLEEE
jgi:putative transposase